MSRHVTCGVLATLAACDLSAGSAFAGAAPPLVRGDQPGLTELWSQFPLDQPRSAGATPPAPAEQSPRRPTQAQTPPGPSDASRALLLLTVPGSCVLLAVAVLVRSRQRRSQPRRDLAPSGERDGRARARDRPEALIQQARALAIEATEWNKYSLRQPPQRSMVVSEQPEVRNPSLRSNGEGPADDSATPARSYTDIGERVAGVLRAAEAAAAEIKAEARSEADVYVRDTREAVNSYASQRRREAEEAAQGTLAEAEAQARATRQAAEQMAEQIEETATRRQDALRQESRSVELRLQRALSGFRQMTDRLEELLEAPLDTDDEGSLAEALDAGRPRQPAA